MNHEHVSEERSLIRMNRRTSKRSTRDSTLRTLISNFERRTFDYYDTDGILAHCAQVEDQVFAALLLQLLAMLL